MEAHTIDFNFKTIFPQSSFLLSVFGHFYSNGLWSKVLCRGLDDVRAPSYIVLQIVQIQC